MYTILDNVTKLYSAPFCEINNGSAMRGLQDMLSNNPNNPMSKFPDNYTLFNIGKFDETLGETTYVEHTKVAELISIKMPSEMEN